MKYVKVKFLSSKDEGVAHGYTYRDTLRCKKYDTVIVPTKYGISMAVVTDVNVSEENTYGFSHNSIVKQVLEKVTIKAVEEIVRADKRKDLEKKLEKKTKDLDKLAKYKLYADLDPELAELVKEYEELV